MKLYELATEYKKAFALVEKAIDEKGEISATALEAVEEIQGDIKTKATNCAIAVKILQTRLDIIEAEAKRIRQLRTNVSKHLDWLKDYVLTNMQLADISEIKTDLLKIMMLNSPVRIEFDDIKNVDEKWVWTRETPYVPKAEIMKHIKDTGEIPEGITVYRGKYLKIT